MFNLLPNTLSIVAFVLLIGTSICMVVAIVLSALIWIVISIAYLWSWPDIFTMWIVIGVTVSTLLIVNYKTGGSFDFDEIGPGGSLCDSK